MENSCLTSRPHPQTNSSEGRNRTCDILVNSQALLPLNYLGISIEPPAGVEPATSRLQGACSATELWGQNTNAGPAFRDLSRSVIGRFASIRFRPVVEKSNPTRPLSSPRRELNSNLRFTKPMHDLRAARADRADDGDRTRLNQLGTLTPHQAASSAEKKTRVAFQTPSWRTAPHLIVAATIVRTIAGRALGYPLSLVEVRGIEPPVPSSQTTYPTVGPHLENVASRTWVARESNPDHRFKRPVHHRNACDPQSRHPLESNQDLPGFSRARRPTTQE